MKCSIWENIKSSCNAEILKEKSPMYNKLSKTLCICITFHVQVTDADIGENGVVDFSLGSSALGIFSINATGPRSAVLYLTSSLDRERLSQYMFSIFAVDRGVPRQTAQNTVSILVQVSNHFNA